MVEALMDAGADPSARDEAGQLPFDYAGYRGTWQGTNIYWKLSEARFI